MYRPDRAWAIPSIQAQGGATQLSPLRSALGWPVMPLRGHRRGDHPGVVENRPRRNEFKVSIRFSAEFQSLAVMSSVKQSRLPNDQTGKRSIWVHGTDSKHCDIMSQLKTFRTFAPR